MPNIHTAKLTSNKPNRIHIRLTDKEKQFIEILSNNLGLSVSDVIRLIIDKAISESWGDFDENNKADFEHIVQY